jgi:mannose-6-phosphate isomerase-like protein (cupin superfamily)
MTQVAMALWHGQLEHDRKVRLPLCVVLPTKGSRVTQLAPAECASKRRGHRRGLTGDGVTQRDVVGGQSRGDADAHRERPQNSLEIFAILAVMAAFDLTSTHVCLSPQGSASTIEVTPEFWATIGERADLREGRLVAVFESDADWPHWEMHPAGDELLVLLSGKMTIVLEEGGLEHMLELPAGSSCLVPRGVWHRAIVPVPSRLLAITYGRGTEHRAR